MEFPVVHKDLLDALERQFPDRSPNPSDTDRQIWMKVGNVQVIRFLRSKFEEQNENVLETQVTTDV